MSIKLPQNNGRVNEEFRTILSDIKDKKTNDPNNGWTKEQEDLLAEWADKASSYRWLHDHTYDKYKKWHYTLSIPVIILSTLTGTANFGMDSLFGANARDLAQIGVGSVSIFAGVLQTLNNFLKYAEYMESHRSCSTQWGKFQRNIATELALHPKDRMHSIDFIKVCRVELDRLIEQSPNIPLDVIYEFKVAFKNSDFKKPEICDVIEHTSAFHDKASDVANIVSQAAMNFTKKKREESRVSGMATDFEAAIDNKRKDLERGLERGIDENISVVNSAINSARNSVSNAANNAANNISNEMSRRKAMFEEMSEKAKNSAENEITNQLARLRKVSDSTTNKDVKTDADSESKKFEKGISENTKIVAQKVEEVSEKAKQSAERVQNLFELAKKMSEMEDSKSSTESKDDKPGAKII